MLCSAFFSRLKLIKGPTLFHNVGSYLNEKECILFRTKENHLKIKSRSFSLFVFVELKKEFKTRKN